MSNLILPVHVAKAVQKKKKEEEKKENDKEEVIEPEPLKIPMLNRRRSSGMASNSYENDISAALSQFS